MNKEIKKYIAQNWSLLKEAQMVTNEEGTEVILKYNKENTNEGKFEFGTYEYKHLNLTDLNDNELFLGVNYKNEGIIVDLNCEPHFLISGIGSNGKSNLTRSFVKQLENKNSKVYALTTKNLVKIIEILEKRKALLRQHNVQNIDKLNEILNVVGEGLERIVIVGIGENLSEEIQEQLLKILVQGKSVNVNVILQVRELTSKTFKYNTILNNLIKIVGATNSVYQSKFLLGNSDAYEKLNPINEHIGEFIYNDKIVKVPYVE